MPEDGGFSFAGAPSPEELADYPLNDLGNAQRLIRLIGGVFDDDGMVDHTSATLLYLRNRGWIAFNGRFWDLEAGEEIARRSAHRVARGLVGQSAFWNEKGIPRWQEFIQKSGNAGPSAAMLSQAASYLTVGLEEFDQQLLTINVQNGTIKFKRDSKGKVKRTFSKIHDPADRITRMAECDFDPDAKCPQFEAMLNFAQPKAEMRSYLQAVSGYAATAETTEQIFVILQGKGNDGKSTYVNAIKDVLGTYAFTAGVETFLDTGLKKSGDASPDLARLAGDTRLICTAEPPRGAKLATGAIKNFTGGGTIVARDLRMGIFEFEPIGKVVLECNGRPNIQDTDDGIWRRIRIILFKRQVSDDLVDKDLKKKLKLERNGILNWILAGVEKWLTEGLTTPDEVLQAIDDYRRGANPFGEWINERVIMDPSAKILATEFYADYKIWCEDNGHERPMTQTTFGRALGDLQILRAGQNSKGKLMRAGARLKERYAPGGEDDAAQFEKPGASGFSPAREPEIPPDAEDWEGA